MSDEEHGPEQDQEHEPQPANETLLELVEDPEEQGEPAITEPGKLMRIALMLREMQEEVRRAETDLAGRERLRIIYERALAQLKRVLSGELQSELDTFTLPFEEGTPSESEIRVAQAQLIGWLEGLFQGIQAAIMNQQMAARQQLEQMRQQRQLPPGFGPDGAQGERRHPPGQYL